MQPDLDIRDAIRSQIKIDGPATFADGSKQIDRAWVTPSIDISVAYFLPFFFGVSDHRAILLDITQYLLIGGNMH